MVKLYTVDTAGPIACLDNILGPLTTPTEMPIGEVVKMLRKKYVIYQHNPVKLTEKVLVTLQNVNSISFSTTRVKATKERLHNRSVQNKGKVVTGKAPLQSGKVYNPPVETKPEPVKEETKPVEHVNNNISSNNSNTQSFNKNDKYNKGNQNNNQNNNQNSDKKEDLSKPDDFKKN